MATQGTPSAPENSELYDTEYVRVVMVGASGWGKSTTGNTLAKRHLFPTSGGAQSVTRECWAFKVKIGDHNVALMDTPAIPDDTHGPEHMAKLVAECRKFRVVHYFMLVVPATLLRVDGMVRAMVAELVKVFGADVVDHLMLCVTHWEYSRTACKRRLRSGRTQEVVYADWADYLRTEYGRGDEFSIPMIMLDNLYDEEEDEDADGMREQMDRLAAMVGNARPYNTAGSHRVTAVAAARATCEYALTVSRGFRLAQVRLSKDASVQALKALIREREAWPMDGNYRLRYAPPGRSAQTLADGRTLRSYLGDVTSATVRVVGAVSGCSVTRCEEMIRRDGVPTSRACPKCSLAVVLEKGGKQVKCPGCKTSFCLSCLKVGQDHHTNPCSVA